MNNKYLMSKTQNIDYVKSRLDTFIDYSLSLSKYNKNHPQYLIALNNFKNGYEFILTRSDLLNDYQCLLQLHSVLMIGLEENVKTELNPSQIIELESMINKPMKSNTETAIDVFLYILDKRLFVDGDVRTALLFANKIMVENGCGFIIIPPYNIDTFRNKLNDFKNNNENDFKEWIYKYCICGKQYNY